MGAVGQPVARVLELGGPVVMVLLAVSVLTLGVIFYKIWQFTAEGVGRQARLQRALSAWDEGDRPRALAELAPASSYLAPLLSDAMGAGALDTPRLRAEAEARFARLEGGLRFLDSVAQLAPLLGLFGTVLGMIEAFQAMQEAGAQVNPARLAGGIWVALLTTALGLAVAMPTALVLSWLEGRLERDRVFAERALHTILRPRGRAQTVAVQDSGSVHA